MHIIAEVRWHIQAQADLDAQRISHLEHDTLIKANERLRQKGSKATNKKKQKHLCIDQLCLSSNHIMQ